MIYYAKLHRSGKGYWTEFLDFNAPGSEGKDLDAVLRQSKEALEGILESLFDRTCDIPAPKRRKGKGWLAVPVDDSIAIPIVLRQLRLKHGWTLQDMARHLGITYQSYQTLETLRKANPTIKTLRRVAEAFDITILDIIKRVA